MPFKHSINNSCKWEEGEKSWESFFSQIFGLTERPKIQKPNYLSTYLLLIMIFNIEILKSPFFEKSLEFVCALYLNILFIKGAKTKLAMALQQPVRD